MTEAPNISFSLQDLPEALPGALRTFNVSTLEQEFWQDNEFLFIDEFLPSPWVVENLAPRASALRSEAHRNKLGRFRKGGALSAFQLETLAPELLLLYRDPKLRTFFSDIIGVPLEICPDNDPHACALYVDSEAGDHMAYHYDLSLYRGARYTVLISLVHNTKEASFLCDLHRHNPQRPMRSLALTMSPGSLILFNAKKLWHALAPVGPGEERILLAFEYLTDPRMNPAARWASNLKDALAYFGLRGIRRPQQVIRK